MFFRRMIKALMIIGFSSLNYWAISCTTFDESYKNSEFHKKLANIKDCYFLVFFLRMNGLQQYVIDIFCTSDSMKIKSYYYVLQGEKRAKMTPDIVVLILDKKDYSIKECVKLKSEFDLTPKFSSKMNQGKGKVHEDVMLLDAKQKDKESCTVAIFLNAKLGKGSMPKLPEGDTYFQSVYYNAGQSEIIFNYSTDISYAIADLINEKTVGYYPVSFSFKPAEKTNAEESITIERLGKDFGVLKIKYDSNGYPEKVGYDKKSSLSGIEEQELTPIEFAA